MLRTLVAIGGFALGGTTAALLSGGNPPHAQPAPIVRHAAIQADRVAVAQTTARVAVAQGLILHPVSTILAVPARMQYGDYRWDDKGVPLGRTWVRVDLKSQIISVFRGGDEIGTAVILYGADGLATPTGKFPILAKLKDHRSQTYDAPMPYTLRLTADVALIACDWRFRARRNDRGLFVCRQCAECAARFHDRSRCHDHE